jgi:hypothetical protein
MYGHFFSIRNPHFDPTPKPAAMIELHCLLWASASSNDPPNNLGYRTLKEQMRDWFIVITEGALKGATHPLLIRISFVRIALFSISHTKILTFGGIFPFQICLWQVRIMFGVIALYIDLTENFLVFFPVSSISYHPLRQTENRGLSNNSSSTEFSVQDITIFKMIIFIFLTKHISQWPPCVHKEGKTFKSLT